MRRERLLFARTILTGSVLFGLLWLMLHPEQAQAQGRELGRSEPSTGDGSRVDWVVYEGSGPGCYHVRIDAHESFPDDLDPGFNMEFQSDGRTFARVYAPLNGEENDHGWYNPCFVARGIPVEADKIIFSASLGETPGEPTTVSLP